VSFLVACKTKGEVEVFWDKLSAGGSALMELGSYPFSPKYGWLQDRYGLSWQLMFRDGAQSAQRITPTLMFVGEQCGKAEEAMRFYASVFRDSAVGGIDRYGKGEEPDRQGTVRHGAFTQEQIDYYWDKLSAVPEAEQCGWLKDKFGLSWQVVPDAMDRMLEGGDKEKIARVTKAFLQMKKFDLAELQRAYEGK
jgi:predicted 3-demethylubiquinone-9 3-methyltransferase (glyoxalase superfamily)